MKQAQPNYDLMLSMAIKSLQQLYNDYKKEVYKNIQYTWYDNNGDFCILEGQEKRNLKIKELEQQIIIVKNKVEELKQLKENYNETNN